MTIFHISEMRKTQCNVEILTTFAKEAKAKFQNLQSLKEDFFNRTAPFKVKHFSLLENAFPEDSFI